MNELLKEKLLTRNVLVFSATGNSNVICSKEELALLIDSFASLGYCLDKKSLVILSKVSSSDLKAFYFDSYKLLSHVKGTNVNHTVFYKNFPSLENVSYEEMKIRAILHYLTAIDENTQGFMNQDIEEEERLPYENTVDLEYLKLVNDKEAITLACEIANNLYEGKTAIPESDFDFLEMMHNDYKDLINPQAIPFKENLALYIGHFANNANDKKLGEVISFNHLRFVKTATDLLRVYAELSKGDNTLRRNVQFISLDRKMRRLFLSMLDDFSSSLSIYDDLAAHEFLWKRAFEKLHVGEYQKQFTSIYNLVKEFRSGNYQTYFSQVEEALSTYDYPLALNLLKIKPGYFARNLDNLIRHYKIDIVLKEFATVVDKVSTPVLYQIWRHFKNRNSYEYRLFVYQGKAYATEDDRQNISIEDCNLVNKMIENALMDRYSSKPIINKVFLSPVLKNYMIPINARNGSKNHHTLTYGSRISLPISEGSIIRVFTHWKNIDDKDMDNKRVDIDLSAELFDEEFNLVKSIAWYDLYAGKNSQSFHSGDLTSAPNGASEFIDLNYLELKKEIRYIAISNSIFTGQEFADVPECFSGVMMRKSMGKTGKIFEPTSVKLKFDLNQTGSSLNCPFVIDLLTNELIWIDQTFDLQVKATIASKYCAPISFTLMKALQTSFNLYDFFLLHQRHLTFVDKQEEAEFVIGDTENCDLSVFDIDKIVKDWL